MPKKINIPSIWKEVLTGNENDCQRSTIYHKMITYHYSNTTVGSTKINSDNITSICTLPTSCCNIGDCVCCRNLVSLTREKRALKSKLKCHFLFLFKYIYVDFKRLCKLLLQLLLIVFTTISFGVLPKENENMSWWSVACGCGHRGSS